MKLDGYAFDDQTITLPRGQTTALAVSGSKLFPLNIVPRVPNGTKFTLKGAAKTFSLVDVNPLPVPEGVWSVTVENADYLKTTTFTVDTKQTPASVDSTPWFEMGSLLFQNVASDTTLFIDGKKVGPVASNQTVPVMAGTHEVKLQSHKYFDFLQPVKVAKTKTLTVVAAQEMSQKINREDWLGIWGYSTLGLGAVSIPLLAIGMNQWQEEVTKHPSSNAPPSNTLMYVGGYGLLAATVTGTLFLFTLNSKIDQE